MPQNAARELFTTAVAVEDPSIDLLEASLLIAKEEYAGLDVMAEMAIVDGIAQRLEGHIDGSAPAFQGVYAINTVLFERLGFVGNSKNYEDPDNSMLNRVLETRRGIPITLSILYLEVARRLGFHAQGVAFPGHFIVRIEDSFGPHYVDPYFRGRLLLRSDLRKRLRRVLGNRALLKQEHLAPATHRQVLSRLLYNLKRIYLRRKDPRRALLACERLCILNPDSMVERRDRGLLYSQVGRHADAIADLQDYLVAHPEADDAARIRGVLNRLLRQHTAEG